MPRGACAWDLRKPFPIFIVNFAFAAVLCGVAKLAQKARRRRKPVGIHKYR
jgi:hypothetical protein